MENIININEPNVIAIDYDKKATFKNVYENNTKDNQVENIQTVSPFVEPVISTPAEILASELTPTQVEPTIVAEPTPIIQEIVAEPVQNPYIQEVTPVQNSDIIQNEHEDNSSQMDYNNEIVLRIINTLTELQKTIDTIGEDVIRLSNFYQKPIDNKQKNNEIPVNNPVIKQPEENVINPIENVIEQPVVNQEISSFSVGDGTTNIFDQPQMGL